MNSRSTFSTLGIIVGYFFLGYVMLFFRTGGGDILFLITIYLGFLIHLAALFIMIIISLWRQSKQVKQYFFSFVIVLISLIAFIIFLKNDGFKLLVSS